MRVRFDSVDPHSADRITPDAQRLVEWTMVLPDTLVAVKRCHASFGTLRLGSFQWGRTKWQV